MVCHANDLNVPEKISQISSIQSIPSITYETYETHLSSNMDVEESCNQLLTHDECHTNTKCSWCSSGAVKSVCHSLENAENLPSSIFLCDGLDRLDMLDTLSVDEFDEYDEIISEQDYNLSLSWHPRWVDFLNFIETFNKKYNETEIELRFNHFLKNLYLIENHDYSFELGINSYADLSQEEFQAFVKSGGYVSHPKNPFIHNNKNQSMQTKRNLLRFEKTTCSSFVSTKSASSLPSEVDWRSKNAVTNVKDQGHCGSCWSFSATGSMEGAWAIKTGSLVSFSEQQLIDCSTLYGNSGCEGGLMENGFEFAIDKGMCNENDLPYKAVGGLCSECNKVAHFSECVNVTPNNQLHLKEAVSYGPVSIAIEADTLVFQFYKSGIINDVKCGTNLDHGVLIVGYGTENGHDYWIVKNSWGPIWGDKGFVKIARSNNVNDAGICGIASQPSYIVV